MWRCDAEGFTDEFARLIDESGRYIKGLKFHPYHSMLPVTAPQIEPYLSFAAEKGLPVEVHSSNDEFSQPRFVYEVAKAHPSINFIMVHMGLITDNNEAIELIGSLPNLYGDTTWVKPESGLKLMKKYGAHKLLFGTDNPIDGPDTYAHPFYKVYMGEFREWVSHDDYVTILRIAQAHPRSVPKHRLRENWPNKSQISRPFWEPPYILYRGQWHRGKLCRRCNPCDRRSGSLFPAQSNARYAAVRTQRENRFLIKYAHKSLLYRL